MKTEANSSLQSLAESRGLKLKWTDNSGLEHTAAPESISAIMRALKLADDKQVETDAAPVVDKTRSSSDQPLAAGKSIIDVVLADAFVVRRSFTQTDELAVDVRFASKELDLAKQGLTVTFTIYEEDGNVRSGIADSISSASTFRIKIPNQIEFGYHRLKVSLRTNNPGSASDHQVDAERRK